MIITYYDYKLRTVLLLVLVSAIGNVQPLAESKENSLRAPQLPRWLNVDHFLTKRFSNGLLRGYGHGQMGQASP
jgi:hypothetical protein